VLVVTATSSALLWTMGKIADVVTDEKGPLRRPKPSDNENEKTPGDREPEPRGDFALTVTLNTITAAGPFKVRVEMKNSIGYDLETVRYKTTGGEQGSLDEGVLTAEMGNDDSLTLSGIPYYTDYTVSVEPEGTDGCEIVCSDGSGTVTGHSAAVFILVKRA